MKNLVLIFTILIATVLVSCTSNEESTVDSTETVEVVDSIEADSLVIDSIL